MAEFIFKGEEVHYGNIRSSKTFIEYCVPEGPILEPLLNPIYINDRPFFLENTEADTDDLTLHHADRDINCICDALQNDLKNIIKQWCNINGMKINSNKSKCLLIYSKHKTAHHPNLSITVDENAIDQVTSHKLLVEYIINENLKWENHLNYFCQKVSSCTSLLYKIKNHLHDMCYQSRA